MALPDTRFNFAGGKKEVAEIVSGIGQAIFSQVRGSLEAASKTVVPSIQTMVTEITEDLSAGPIDRFNDGLAKVDHLVNKMGVDLSMYSKDLNKFLNERTERARESEETINQLRTQNIIAQVNKFGEVSILTQTEIEDQKKLLKEQNIEIRDSQKIIEKYSKIQQKGGELDVSQRQELVEANEKVIKSTQQRSKTLETLNISEGEDKKSFREKFDDTIDTYVPDGLRDIGSAFTEGLMAPFTAIKDLGMMFGNMLKPLKMLPKLLKGFTVGLLGALMAMLPYLLIVGAVVLAIMGLMKILDHFGIGLDDIIDGLISFKDFLFELPGKIADGFKTIFTKIQNFFIDAINGVIGLINKIPGIEIEKVDRKELPQEEGTDYSKVTMAAPGAGNFDTTTATEQQDNAFLVPPTANEGMSFMEKMKTSPVNNEYLPTSSTSSASSNAIIDNSVKTVNQNNTTQAMAIGSRNDDNTIFRTSDIAV
tara:strand:- start:1237 stop:2673 length:1437 start_codon:yes stop_codon:yes gene_type:complete